MMVGVAVMMDADCCRLKLMGDTMSNVTVSNAGSRILAPRLLFLLYDSLTLGEGASVEAPARTCTPRIL